MRVKISFFCKIDRVFVNEGGIYRLFNDGVTHFLPKSVSDRCPGIIHIHTVRESEPPSFRFFNMWTLDDQFGEIVHSSWQKQVQGCLMYQAAKKLKLLKYD